MSKDEAVGAKSNYIFPGAYVYDFQTGSWIQNYEYDGHSESDKDDLILDSDIKSMTGA